MKTLIISAFVLSMGSAVAAPFKCPKDLTIDKKLELLSEASKKLDAMEEKVANAKSAEEINVIIKEQNIILEKNKLLVSCPVVSEATGNEVLDNSDIEALPGDSVKVYE